MGLREEIHSLLQQTYDLINYLNRDMAPEEQMLQQSKRRSQALAEDTIKMLHKLVDNFGCELRTKINSVIQDKAEVLAKHSEEIAQFLEFTSYLCMMAENLIKEVSLEVMNFNGPKLKEEFLKILKESRDLKLIDYSTFVSVDVEVDLKKLFYIPFVSIISRNSDCSEKWVLHSLNFKESDIEPRIGGVELLTAQSCNSIIQHGKCENQNLHKTSVASGKSPFITAPEKLERERVKIKQEACDKWQSKRNQFDDLLGSDTDQYICGKSASNVEQTVPWNLKEIGSLQMTFDLQTVMSVFKNKMPEIRGELVKTISGNSCTSFSYPIGVTVTRDGLVILADTGNNVVKIMQDNTLIRSIGDHDGVRFVRPSAVVSDCEGHVYVKDDFCVQVFDSSGKLLKMVGKNTFLSPCGLALVKPATEPYLIVLDAGEKTTLVHHYFIREDKLLTFTYQPFVQYGTSASKLRFLATYKDLMLASDLGAHSLYLSRLDGEAVKSFGRFGHETAQFQEPSGVTVDAAGNWLVADSKNNRIQVFTKDGSFQARLNLSSSIRQPSGIHLTCDGHLYVVNYLDAIVQVFRLHK